MGRMSVLLGLAVVALLCAASSCSANNNITEILASHPSYSTFASLCQRTGVASQILSRTTITVLVPPNSVLDALVHPSTSTATLYAIVSYHVLLDYFDTSKFKAITNGTTLSTTLYQTSGQANGNEGFVNITSRGGTIRIGAADKGAPLNVVVQNELFKQPYNISVVSVSGVLIPDGVGAPEPAPAPVNFTEILIQAKNYNTFLSLIKSTGVDALLLKHDTPPGVTIFAPDDSAFAKLPKGALGKLSSAEQVALLEFHCLGSYFSTQELGTLNSAQLTLASGSGGGKYEYDGITLTKSGDTIINTGYNKVAIGPTLYSQEPLGLYGISTVLLPTDIFGLPPSAAPAPSPTPVPSPAPVPSSAPAPAPSSSSSAPSPSPEASHSASPPAPPGSSLAASPHSQDNAALSSHLSGQLTLHLAPLLLLLFLLHLLA